MGSCPIATTGQDRLALAPQSVGVTPILDRWSASRSFRRRPVSSIRYTGQKISTARGSSATFTSVVELDAPLIESGDEPSMDLPVAPADHELDLPVDPSDQEPLHDLRRLEPILISIAKALILCVQRALSLLMSAREGFPCPPARTGRPQRGDRSPPGSFSLMMSRGQGAGGCPDSGCSSPAPPPERQAEPPSRLVTAQIQPLQQADPRIPSPFQGTAPSVLRPCR